MRSRLTALTATAVVAVGLTAAPALAGPPDCNWGHLTADAVADGFPQGAHSSDPSGDGHGPGTADEPRVGLANVVETGDLEATCVLIDDLFNP